MRNFNKHTFIILSVVIGLLLIPSFLAAWADDEGTLGANAFLNVLANTFYVLRFPTHSLLWTIFSSNSFLFLLGLFINCLFYAFILERVTAFLKHAKSAL
jgi:hypothetical protein